MTLLPTALPRPAQAMSAPREGGSLAVSFLLHALGIGGLVAASVSAPKTSRPAPVIELVAAPRPVLSSPTPVPPPPSQAPVPERPRHRTPPPAPRPQPAPPPPATARDESALARADTLAQPTAADTVPGALPPAPTRPTPEGIPGGTAPAGLSGPSPAAGLQGALVSVTRLDRMPVLTVAHKPEYTAEMKRRNLAGRLKAKVLVDSDGMVKDAVVLTHLGYGTREAGLAALRRLEFEPGYADGAAVAVWIPFTFTFEWQE